LIIASGIKLIKGFALHRQFEILFCIGRLAAGKLDLDFKTPWNFLAETAVRAARLARGEVNSSSNSLMWRWAESNRRA